MATFADLRMRPCMKHAYVLLIEGVPFAFTDEYSLSTVSGTGWWDVDDRVILNGLVVPSTLTISAEVESWQFEDQGVTFQLLDLDETTIPQFFGNLSKDFDLLGERLPPTTDPAPAFLANANQGTFAPAGGYLGTEAIGPEGERHYYSATPWAPGAPGQDHPSHDEPKVHFTTHETGPYLVEGRKVTLIRVIWDEDANTWLTPVGQWGSALDLGVAPAFWLGTLRQAGEVDGRLWSIECAGPGSWVRRTLAQRANVNWYPMTADFEIEIPDNKIIVSFTKHLFSDASNKVHGYDAFSFVDPLDPFGSIKTVVDATAVAVGPDGAWTDPGAEGAGTIVFSSELVSVTIEDQGVAFNANCFLTLHFKVWRALGYDPIEDEGNIEGPGPKFRKAAVNLPGYWVGIFSTTPAGLDPEASDLTVEWAGVGLPHVFYPTYPGGLSIISGLAGQVLRVHTDNEAVYVESQTIRPTTGGAIDGVDCDATRWWVFKGPLQLEGGEVEETVQIARCSWVEDSPGYMAFDDSGITRGLRIAEWLDPRLWGLNHKPIPESLGWATPNDIADDGEDHRVRCSPLSAFAVYHRNPDRAARTILRTLLSTGTASWNPCTDTGSDALLGDLVTDFFADGINGVYDAEIADLGLGLPIEHVDVDSILAAEDDLLYGASSKMGLGKCAVHGPIQSEDLLAGIMAPRNWAWSLINGKFGIWTPHISAEEKYQEGVDASITDDDKAGVGGDPGSTAPKVGLRPVFPYERLAASYTGDPLSGWDSQVELSLKARDVGARARMGNNERSLSCPDLIATEWLVGDDNAKIDAVIPSWQKEFRSIWEGLIPTYLAKPHRLLEGLRVSRPKGQDLGVGSIVRITDPWPANPYGTYGLSGVVGRVISVTHETDSCVAIINVLIEATPPDLLKWAPILRVIDDVATVEERYDPDTETWFFQPCGVDPPFPLASLIRPDDFPLEDGEDELAQLVILSYDGVTWTKLAVIEVESVNTAAWSLTAAGPPDWDGSFSGSNWPSRGYLVMVLNPYQINCWATRRFAHHTQVGGDLLPKLIK